MLSAIPTHPLMYYLQLPKEITLYPMPVTITRFWILYWIWNSKLQFGLSRLVYGGPCRHCAVFSLICMSVLFFSTFPTAPKYFTLCLYRLWSLPRFISGYYTDVNKKMSIVFMLHVCCIQAEIMWLLLFLMSFVINFLFVIHLILGSHVALLVIAHQCFIAFPH